MRKYLIAMCLPMLVMFGGCTRWYETPVYENVDTHETAFVVPLEGNTADQAKFDSREQLEEYKVAAKRIRVTRRWNKTGILYDSGEWIPTIRVIKVDRSPVTREWKSDNKDSGNGIWIESNDSVGFCTGFSITAMVEEQDSALYLYTYKGNALSQTMDTEVRARVQSIAAEVAAKYKMDELRTRKNDIILAIREDILPYFEKKGVTITTIGMFGGFAYENDAIQKAIDNVFVAQQEKEVAAATLSAQKDKNTTLEMEGRGMAAKVREIAMGEKDAAITKAQGEAEGIKLVADAAAAAASNPTFVTLRQLEVQQKQIERWNGAFPAYLFTSGGSGGASNGNPMLLLEMPKPAN